MEEPIVFPHNEIECSDNVLNLLDIGADRKTLILNKYEIKRAKTINVTKFLESVFAKKTNVNTVLSYYSILDSYDSKRTPSLKFSVIQPDSLLEDLLNFIHGITTFGMIHPPVYYTHLYGLKFNELHIDYRNSMSKIYIRFIDFKPRNLTKLNPDELQEKILFCQNFLNYTWHERSAF